MAEPFARFEWMGRQVLCYLRPGTQCDDLPSLASEAPGACRACESHDDLDTEMEVVASRHDLTAERSSPEEFQVSADQAVSYGFMPRMR